MKKIFLIILIIAPNLSLFAAPVIAIEDSAFYNIKIESYLTALKDFEKYLQEKLPFTKPVIVSINNPKLLIQKMKRGEIHLALTTDLTFIKLFSQVQIQPLLLPSYKLADNKTYRKYNIQIISNSLQNLSSIESLKNKIMAVTAEDTSSYTTEFLYFKYLLLQKYMENKKKNAYLKNIFSYIRLKRHKDAFSKISATMVATNNLSQKPNGAHFTSVKSDDIDEFCAQISTKICSNINIISRSPDLRRGPFFAIQNQLSPDTIEIIKKIFMEMNKDENGKKILSLLKINSFENALAGHRSIKSFIMKEYSNLFNMWTAVEKFESRNKL